jgi:CRP-like cAMP-binding protein
VRIGSLCRLLCIRARRGIKEIPMHESNSTQSQNRMLAALPSDEYQRLQPLLTPAELTLGMVLYETGGPVGYVYFPVNCLISLVVPMEDGSAIEVGLVGNDGMSGVSALIGEAHSTDRAIVQIAGGAVRASLTVIKEEFSRGGALHDLLFRYMTAHLKLVSQTLACNARHSVEKRLARWLLICKDRVASDDLKLTQEFIAEMLGTRRATVSMAASALQTEGLIEYRRGNIRILDQQGLEGFSCECYRVVKEESDRLLGQRPQRAKARGL